jgi:hypothetical protein
MLDPDFQSLVPVGASRPFEQTDGVSRVAREPGRVGGAVEQPARTPLVRGQRSRSLEGARRDGVRTSLPCPSPRLLQGGRRGSVRPGGGEGQVPGAAIQVTIRKRAGEGAVGCPAIVGGCGPVGPGDAFVEPGADVHLGRNEGAEPVELNAIFLAPTGTTEFVKPQQQPKACNV